MINMSNIAIDLSNNGGEYLNTLLHLANLESNESSYDLLKDTLIKSKGDQVSFGIAVTKL